MRQWKKSWTIWMNKLVLTVFIIAGISVHLNGASAATITVTTNADSGAGSLRQAIADATAGDTITFDMFDVDSPIVLTSGTLTINKNLTITGPGANRLTVQRNASASNFRIFSISSATVAISGLTISNGAAANGGGLENNGGTVTLSNCTLSNNSTTIFNGKGVGIYNTNNGTMSLTGGTPGSAGGGIYNDSGAVSLTNCTLNDNGAERGGGIHSAGALTATNCTFFNNTAAGSSPLISAYGGAISSTGTLALTNCTFTGNTAHYGAALDAGAGTADIVNCTFSGNNAVSTGLPGQPTPVGGINIGGATVDLVNSIVTENTGDDISGTLATDDHNLVGVDIKLGPLQDNSGPTHTMTLLESSPPNPAIDGGNNAVAPATDQRGYPRPIPAGGTVDVGAYELDFAQVEPNLVVTVDSDSTDGMCGVGHCTLREAIEVANSNAVASTIIFNIAGPAPHTIQLTSALPGLATDITINGPGAANLTVRRSPTNIGLFGIFTVSAGANVTLSGLTLSNGNTANGGGLYNSGGKVTLNSCTFAGNVASSISSSNNGGAIFNTSDGLLTVNSCTFSDNDASGFTSTGGAIANSGSTVSLTNCTFSGNSANHGSAIQSNGTLTATGCTFNNNTGTGIAQFSASNGGAIYNSGSMGLTNCTFSSNVALFGGGIYNTGTANILNCTISGNQSSGTGGAPGGGINNSGGTLHLTNSIVTASTGTDIAGSLATDDHNLIGVDAKLGPLQDNGGPTHTMALSFQSPAVNAGNGTGAPGTDQRGTQRPAGAAVDIGAYEFEAGPIGNPVVTTTVDENDGDLSANDVSLREAIMLANFYSDNSTITFNLPGAAPHHHTEQRLARPDFQCHDNRAGCEQPDGTARYQCP